MNKKNIIGRTAITFLLLSLNMKVFSQQVKAKYVAPEVIEKNLDGGIKLVGNLRYGQTPDNVTNSSSDRILDLYLPASETKNSKLPLFLFIHGGGFTGGGKALPDLCTKIAKMGYVVASINYRLMLKDNKIKEAGCGANMSNGLPETGKFHPKLQNAVSIASEDAAEALKWLAKNANIYSIDIKKVVVSGGSAGAMTALNLAYVVRPKEIKIKAVIDLWGGLENAQVIKRDSPPVLIFHGDKDDTINVAYAYALNERMEQIGSKASKMVIMEGKGHAQYKYITDTKIDEIDSFIKSIINP